MIKKEDIKVGLVFDYPLSKVDKNGKSIDFIPEDKSSTGRFQISDIIKIRENLSYADCYYLDSPIEKNITIPLSGIEANGVLFLTGDEEFEKLKAISLGLYPKNIDYLNGMLEERLADETNKQKEILREQCEAFKAITDKMSDTYKRKNHDYGNAFSEMYDELGINYGYGKIREKVNRIKTLKDNEAQVANEPLEDALLDCANYCILTLMEYQKRKGHSTD